MPQTPPFVLTVAGSDSGGGAGIQADLKTMLALGAYGMSVLCAITAQNSHGVHGAWDLPPEAVRAQLSAVLSDMGADAVKTGMLSSGEIIEVVADSLAGLDAPVVVDPVAVSAHGDPLLAPDAVKVLRERLLPLATVITPNLHEAELLTGIRATGEAGMAEVAAALHALGPRWVLVKGGHLPGDPVDLLFDGERLRRYPGPRVDTPHTHGTGCTLASAIATRLAFGDPVPASVAAAKEFVTGALNSAYPVGTGIGPVDHGWRLRNARTAEAPRG